MSVEQPKIGLFLCKCGTNIANFVDLAEVDAAARQRADVAFVATHDLLCSPAGKKFIQDTIEHHAAGSIVIAACSPKMHEKTFRDVASVKGVNLAQVHMANIREQAGWVTPDKAAATAKAKSLVCAALRRMALHEDLEPRFMDVQTDLVVIGGGIAGIEAALMAAAAGRKVTIIEREISLGGSLIKTEEIAPNMECAPCILAPRLAAIRDNKNITVITNAEVTDVLGFFGNFTVRLNRRARYVTGACIGCEACFEACPVSVTSSFHLGLGQHKAIYTAFPGSVPAAAAIDRDHCAHFADGSCCACVAACSFNAINFEDADEATELKAGAVILATGHGSPLPSACTGLGAGVLDNVYTMDQFERLASSNGPTGGEIRCVNGEQPRSLAVVHCAGSLQEQGLAYCSGICCMNAVKAGELARKKMPGVEVYNIHDRLVFDGPAGQEFYQRQLHEGTTFLKTSSLSSIAVQSVEGMLSLSAEGMDPVQVDMVVLSTGLTPAPAAAQLAEMLALECDSGGFYKADHPILHAMGSRADGVYLAGSCASPCSAAVAITRAHAAAGDVLSRLVPGKRIELEIMTATINEELCAGCRLCITVCPYKAIAFDPAKKVSVINEALCRGCGTCAATCPGAAATAAHYTNAQIYAELQGVIHG